MIEKKLATAVVTILILSACATIPEGKVTSYCGIAEKGLNMVGQTVTTEIAIVDLSPHGFIAMHPDCPKEIMAVAWPDNVDWITRRNIYRVSTLSGPDYLPSTRVQALIDSYPSPVDYPDAGQLRPIMKISRILLTTYPTESSKEVEGAITE